MRKVIYLVAVSVFSFQACERGLIVEDAEYNNEFFEKEIHCIVTAGLPSDKRDSWTRVVLDGDYPSAPIVANWQGSTSYFQDRFAIVGEDNDGNIAHITDALRLVDETEDSVYGTFEFSFDKDYWIDDLEYKRFYALYPVRDYDSSYYTGRDNDYENWLYGFSEQSGLFSDLNENLFMVSPRIDIDNPSIEFEYGIAILRLSNLCIPDLIGQTVSNLKVKSNAIRDAIVFNSNCSFSDYYAAGNEISITGRYNVNSQGRINDNIYIVFFPSSDSIDYLLLSLEIDGHKYSYNYTGSLTNFSAGKVYTLNGAELSFKDTSPDYDWYLNPIVEDHYLISNVKEFLGFAKIVNGDSDALSIVGRDVADSFESKTVSLADNAEIDLSVVLDAGENWKPITGFRGTLDGRGASIVNVYFDGSFHYDGAEIGLFANLENACVESLTVCGVINVNGCYYGNIGGIVGYCNQSSVLNCTASLSIMHSSGDSNCIGGIAGRSRGSFIIGCLDSSTITDSRDADYVGGIVGHTSSYSKIVGCAHLNGQLRSTEGSRVGGIVGHEPEGMNEIIACYNNATIRGIRPGQILGGCGLGIGTPQITNSYYSGNGDAYRGVGSLNGTGSGGDVYDYGTQRIEQESEMITACEEMNSKIDEWNYFNPSMLCIRRYDVENGQIVFN